MSHMRPKLQGFHCHGDGLCNKIDTTSKGRKWGPRIACPESAALVITVKKGNNAEKEDEDLSAEIRITGECAEAEVCVAGIKDP